MWRVSWKFIQHAEDDREMWDTKERVYWGRKSPKTAICARAQEWNGDNDGQDWTSSTS